MDTPATAAAPAPEKVVVVIPPPVRSNVNMYVEYTLPDVKVKGLDNNGDPMQAKKLITVKRDVIDRCTILKEMFEDIMHDGDEHAHGHSESNPIPISTPGHYEEAFDYIDKSLTHPREVPEDVVKRAGKAATEDTPKWAKEYLDTLPPKQLPDLLQALNYLHAKAEIDDVEKALARRLNGKTAEQIGTMFDVKCDFAPEDIASIKKENDWCAPHP